jgi:hypothetical protein
VAIIADDLPPEDRGTSTNGDDLPPAGGGICWSWGFDFEALLDAVTGPAPWLRLASLGSDAEAECTRDADSDSAEDASEAGAAGSADSAAGERADLDAVMEAEQEAYLEAVAAGVPELPLELVAGRVAENLPVGPGLAGWLALGRAQDLEDGALAGVAASFRRLGSWAAAGELAAVAQIASRSARTDLRASVDLAGRPDRVTADAAGQVSLALAMSHDGAAAWADLGVALEWRLRATGAALAAGEIDLARARMIARVTGPLSDEAARQVEAAVLGRAGWQTLGQLHAALRAAVIKADPEGAERRRREAERNAQVVLYPEDEGTASLAGYALPGVQASAAMARITALARAMQAAGNGGQIDLVRAQVFLGLLLGTLPYIPPPPGGPDDPPPGGPDDVPPGGPDDAPPGGPDDVPPGGPDNAPQDDDSPAAPSAPVGQEPRDPPVAPSAPDDLPADDLPPDDDWPDAPGVPDGLTPGDVPSGDLPSDDLPVSDPVLPEGPVRDGRPDWSGCGDLDARDQAVGPAAADIGCKGSSGVGPVWPWPEVLPFLRDGPTGLAGRAPPVATGGGLLNLMVSLGTLTGRSAAPGKLSRLGVITPRQARQLTALAATNLATRWRIVITSPEGEAIAVTHLPRPRVPQTLAGRAGLIGRATLIIRTDQLAIGTGAPAPETENPASLVPPGSSLARIVDRARVAAGRAAAAAAERQAQDEQSGGCGHQLASAAYRPPSRIADLVIARDGTCRFGPCRRPAEQCDLDHVRPYHQGGLTCMCNLGGDCRLHHQLKQHRGWSVTQPVPGVFRWRTPAGRTYITRPDLYLT